MLIVDQGCQPIDPHTRHRFHWVKRNDFECWEWLRNGSWLRPGKNLPLTSLQAAIYGWQYIKEATV